MAFSIDVAEMRKAPQAVRPANILAVGTTTPSNCFYQADYPHYYFRVTKSKHMVDLKEKFKRTCEKTTIRKRYMHLTEEFLKENPHVSAYMAPYLDNHGEIYSVKVPNLGKEASIKANNDYGRPMSGITHLIFGYQLANLLGLNPSYQQGCLAGDMVLRLANDLAKNNKGAHVRVVCCEMTVISLCGPS